MARETLQGFEALLPDLPYIGGNESPNTKALCMTAAWLALCRSLQAHGASADAAARHELMLSSENGPSGSHGREPPRAGRHRGNGSNGTRRDLPTEAHCEVVDRLQNVKGGAMDGLDPSAELPEKQQGAKGGALRGEVPVGADAPIIEVMRTTRAMRHLAPDPVPQDLIRAIIEAGTWGPSGGNSQPANYVVVTDRATMARLAPLWDRVIDDYRFAMASSGALQGSGPSHERMRASIEYQRAHFAEVPALIVICEDARALGVARGTFGTIGTMLRRGGVRRALRVIRAFPRFRRGEAAFYYPAAENILLAARAYGLAACFTSWHLFAEDEFKRVIGIPKDVRTWAIIPIGYPLKRFGPVNRRPVDEVIRWETW